MKYNLRAILALSFLTVLGLGVFATQAQLDTPVGVIDKPAFESDRQVRVETNGSVLPAATPVIDIVTFEINAPSAVYLFSIPPDGGAVQMIYPNRDDRDHVLPNESDAQFPQSFGFPTGDPEQNNIQFSQPTGQYVIQAVATPFIINLEPPDENSPDKYLEVAERAEDFPALIRELIGSHGISDNEWAASWDSFVLVSGLTASGGDRRFVMKFVKSDGSSIPSGIVPSVRISAFDPETGRPVVKTPPVRNGEAIQHVDLPPGNQEIMFEAEVRYYSPSPNTTCDLYIAGDLIFPNKAPCDFGASELEDFDHTEDVELVFKFTSPTSCDAVFVTAPASPTAQQQVTFDASGAEDVCPNATSFEWDFGDGSGTITGVRPQHTYVSPGVYDVSLSVINPGAEVITNERSVSIGPPLPPVCPEERLCLQLKTGNFDLVPPQSSQNITIGGTNGFGEVRYDPFRDPIKSDPATYPAGPACLDFIYEVNSFASPQNVSDRLFQAYSLLVVRYNNLNPDRDTTEPIAQVSDRYLFEIGQLPTLGVPVTKQLTVNIPRDTEEINVLIDTAIQYNGTGDALEITFSSFRLDEGACASGS